MPVAESPPCGLQCFTIFMQPAACSPVPLHRPLRSSVSPVFSPASCLDLLNHSLAHSPTSLLLASQSILLTLTSLSLFSISRSCQTASNIQPLASWLLLSLTVILFSQCLDHQILDYYFDPRPTYARFFDLSKQTHGDSRWLSVLFSCPFFVESTDFPTLIP